MAGRVKAVYARCRTCARYIVIESAEQDRYCSDSCAQKFLTCCNCGSYFTRQIGHSGKYCSRECSVKYRLHRIFGPEPITVITEELV